MSFRRAFAVWLFVVAACSAGPGPATTTTVLDEPAASTTVMESTTTQTSAESSSSSPPDRVTLERFNPIGGGGDFRSLREGTVWVMPLDGVTIELTPVVSGWVVLGLSNSRAVFGWTGPAGQGTLEAVVFNVGFDGVENAWSRIEALGAGLDEDVDWEWTWLDQGTGFVGDRETEWREVRLPPVPADDDVPDWDAVPVIQAPFPVVLGHDSTARFYVVPIGDDVTATVLIWESRCVCPPDGLLFRNFVDDDIENELAMWIDELEAFLGGMYLVAEKSGGA